MHVEEHSFSGACGKKFGGRKPTCARGLKVVTAANAFDLCPRPHALRRSFFNAYKGPSSALQHVDAFVCNHPPALCELYMPFNKSILVIASVCPSLHALHALHALRALHAPRAPWIASAPHLALLTTFASVHTRLARHHATPPTTPHPHPPRLTLHTPSPHPPHPFASRPNQGHLSPLTLALALALALTLTLTRSTSSSRERTQPDGRPGSPRYAASLATRMPHRPPTPRLGQQAGS